MTKKNKGFTLIELMIVVAIIGILAAVAIPAYQTYIARGQVSEAMSLTSGTKSPIAEFYADKGKYPAQLASVTNISAGKYVSSVAISFGAGSPSGILRVTATMKATGLNPNIASGTFSIATDDGGRTWDCGEVGNAADGTNLGGANEIIYIPGACK
jgi:type IV pilus assembly protein PilA